MLKRLALALVLAAGCLVSAPAQAQDSREQAWAEWTKLFNQTVFQGTAYQEQTLAGFRVFADKRVQDQNPDLPRTSPAHEMFSNLYLGKATAISFVRGTSKEQLEVVNELGRDTAARRIHGNGEFYVSSCISLNGAGSPGPMYSVDTVTVTRFATSSAGGVLEYAVSVACFRAPVQPTTSVAELTSPNHFNRIKALVSANTILLRRLF